MGCAVVDGDARLGVVERLLALPVVRGARARRRATLLVPMVRDASGRSTSRRKRIEVDGGFLGDAA